MRKPPFNEQETEQIQQATQVLGDYAKPKQIVEDLIREQGWGPMHPRTTCLMVALDSLKNPRKHP